MNCKKSYILTEEQEKRSKELAERIWNKNKKYEGIVCETVFDAGIFFEPTEDELNELED